MIKINFYGNPYIGIFAKANEKCALIPEDAHRKFEQAIAERLKVDVAKTSIAGSSLIGIYSVMNSRAVVVPNVIYAEEVRRIERETGLAVCIIDTKNTAIGNSVCCNDNGAIISSAMEKENVSKIERALDVEAVQMDVAGYVAVGSACTATNEGFVAHNDVDDDELEKISKVLGGCGGINGTVNFGFPFPAYGIIANSSGYVVGEKTTGIELMRIEQGLGFSKRIV